MVAQTGSTTTTGELGFKNLSIDPGQRHAETYTLRERERREALSSIKADPIRLDWCKKHTPLCPTRPVQEGWAGQYDAMMAGYAEKMSAWESYCQGGSLPNAFAAAPAAPASTLGMKNLTAVVRPDRDEKAIEKKQTVTADCFMAPVAKKAKRLGADGAKLIADTDNELKAFMRELRQNPKSGAPNVVKIFSEGLTHSAATNSQSGAVEQSLTTKILATRHDADGQIHVSVSYAYADSSGKRTKTKELQNVIVLDDEARVRGAHLSTDIGNDARECVRGSFPGMRCSYSARTADCREDGAGVIR